MPRGSQVRYGLLTPRRARSNPALNPGLVVIPMRFRNETVRSACRVRANERGCGLWSVMRAELSYSQLQYLGKFKYDSAREFRESLDRLLASDWLGVFGASILEEFVEAYKEASDESA